MNKIKNNTNRTTYDVPKFLLSIQESENLFLGPYTNKAYCSPDKTMIIQNSSEVEQMFITKTIIVSNYFS